MQIIICLQSFNSLKVVLYFNVVAFLTSVNNRAGQIIIIPEDNARIFRVVLFIVTIPEK